MKYNETVRFFFSQGQTDTNAKREAIQQKSCTYLRNQKLFVSENFPESQMLW